VYTFYPNLEDHPLNVSVKYKALTNVIKAAKLLEQAIAVIPPEDRTRQGRGVQFDSERGREAVKRRWQKSSLQKALKKLGGDAA
jgi:hypothetical protein